MIRPVRLVGRRGGSESACSGIADGCACGYAGVGELGYGVTVDDGRGVDATCPRHASRVGDVVGMIPLPLDGGGVSTGIGVTLACAAPAGVGVGVGAPAHCPAIGPVDAPGAIIIAGVTAIIVAAIGSAIRTLR